MILARRALTMTAFSPVAARSAPPFNIFSVAVELVPTAVMSAWGRASRSLLVRSLPRLPP